MPLSTVGTTVPVTQGYPMSRQDPVGIGTSGDARYDLGARRALLLRRVQVRAVLSPSVLTVSSSGLGVRSATRLARPSQYPSHPRQPCLQGVAPMYDRAVLRVRRLWGFAQTTDSAWYVTHPTRVSPPRPFWGHPRVSPSCGDSGRYLCRDRRPIPVGTLRRHPS